MSRLWTPPKTKPRDRENTARFAAAVRSATFEDAVCRRWNRELERLDPLLRLVKNRSDDQWIVGTPLVPGAYHLLRANPGAPMTVEPLLDDEGRPLAEPPGTLLERLKRMDLQNPAVVARMRKEIAEHEARQAREKELQREQRQHNILKDWKGVTDASVSLNRDTPWTQNASGKRGAKS